MADEYIKRKDVINAIESLPTWWADDGGFYGGAKPPMVALLDPEDTISAIENIPSEDVVEVVRCKDCSHGHKTSYPSELRICLTTGCFHSENHFCSDGKRMDGGT